MNPNHNDDRLREEADKTIFPQATTSRYRSKSQDTLDRYDTELQSVYTIDIGAFEENKEKPNNFDNDYDVYPGVEHSDYDFAAERKNTNSINFFEAMAYLIKTCLGVGILGIHEGYKNGGLWTSLVFSVVIGIMTSHAMLVLIKSAQKLYVRLRICKLSYADLAELALATSPLKCSRKSCKVFRYIVDLFILCQQCSACCCYEIATATTLKEISEDYIQGLSELNWPLSIYILITSIPLVLITTIRRFKILAHLSVCADVIIMICVTSAMYFGITAAGDIRERPAWKSFHGLFRFLGVCIYSVDGTPLALPIENNMSAPRLFPFVVFIAMTIVVTSVIAVGFIGYWGYGEACRTPITIHIPLNVVYIVLQFLLILMFLVTYALNLYVPFHIVKRYTRKYLEKRHACWDKLIRLLHVVVTTCVCIMVPNLVKFMSVIGYTFVVFIEFVFPAIIETLVSHPEVTRFKWVFIKNVFIMCFAFIMLIGGICSDAYVSQIS